MKRISRNEFISGAENLEQLYLLEVFDGKVFLRSDIEYGGDLQIPRVEIMRFEMNTEMPISIACSECRSRYSGGISFIEYYNESEAMDCALNDFLELANDAVYLSCKDNELSNIAESFTKAYIYTVLKNAIVLGCRCRHK